MNGLKEIRSTLLAHKNELSQNYRLKEIGLFGSYVKGAQKKNSDIDILVAFEKVPGLLKFLELESRLSDILGIRVDLVRKEAIREELKESILKETISI